MLLFIPSRNTTPVGTPSCSPHLRSPPASFHLHSPWQRAGVLLVVYSTAQRCSALPRNNSSEQERPVRSAVLIWSSSAGHTPQRPWPLRRTPTAWNDRARAQCSQYPGSAHLTAEYRPPMQAYGAARSEFDRAAAIRNLSRGSDRLRCPSRPKQHWDFDPAEKELTPLPVPGYGFGHRKRWFKNPIHATIALTVEGALLARSYAPSLESVLDH